MNRVVVTGSYAITPVGTGTEKFWENIINGRSGIKKVSKFDTKDLTCHVAAEVNDFDPNLYMEKKDYKKMDLFVQYAVAAAISAVKNAGINMEKEDAYDVGVVIGSGIGGITTFETQYLNYIEKGPSRVSPFFIPMLITNMGTGQVAIMTGAKGFNFSTVSACASGADAVGHAYLAIKRGDAKVMIAGGGEASVSFLPFSGFCAMKAMSSCEDPEKACRPFDVNRDGFVMGEGAAVLILESLEHATKREANILAEIVGFASTNDSFHITAPAKDGQSASKCMSNALRNTGISPDKIDYINAHGTSTPYNDRLETLAIKNVFKEHAYKLKISSTKSITGHLLGAAGALEAMITTYALKYGVLPPTINYNESDPECDLNYIPNNKLESDINYAISNSFGFGGHNTCIVMKRYDE